MYCLIEFHLLGQWQESLLRCRNIAINLSLYSNMYLPYVTIFYSFLFVVQLQQEEKRKMMRKEKAPKEIQSELNIK